MNGEPTPFLEVSASPNHEQEAIDESLRATEQFLSNLSPDQQAAFIGDLISGELLEAINGFDEGRKLAELRLDKLRGSVSEAAAKLFLPQRRPVRR